MESWPSLVQGRGSYSPWAHGHSVMLLPAPRKRLHCKTHLPTQMHTGHSNTHNVCVPLSHFQCSGSSYRHGTAWQFGALGSRSAHSLPSLCATLTHTPASAPDLAMACALLHFTYHVQIIVHIGAVNSNLSLLTCPQRMILLFHYPLLGGNRSKIFFFLILFALHCRLIPLTAVVPENISNWAAAH